MSITAGQEREREGGGPNSGNGSHGPKDFSKCIPGNFCPERLIAGENEAPDWPNPAEMKELQRWVALNHRMNGGYTGRSIGFCWPLLPSSSVAGTQPPVLLRLPGSSPEKSGTEPRAPRHNWQKEFIYLLEA